LIFFLGVPTGIVAAILGLLILPQKREYQGMPIDYTGLLCLAGFLVPLLLAISFGRDGETAAIRHHRRGSEHGEPGDDVRAFLLA
jgi:hypothetical protein